MFEEQNMEVPKNGYTGIPPNHPRSWDVPRFSILNHPAVAGPHDYGTPRRTNPRGAMTQGKLAAMPKCQIRAFLRAALGRCKGGTPTSDHGIGIQDAHFWKA